VPSWQPFRIVWPLSTSTYEVYGEPPQLRRRGSCFSSRIAARRLNSWLHVHLPGYGHRRDRRSNFPFDSAGSPERGPTRPPFLRLRALIKLHAGNLEGAGSDIKEALAINSQDPNSLQLDGNLLAKLGRPEEAITVYKKILAIDPVNRFALTSLGYVSREAGHDQEAEKYFQKLAAAYPTLYVPYLALGDLYAAHKDFAKADGAYRKGYELARNNSLIVAGGMRRHRNTSIAFGGGVVKPRHARDAAGASPHEREGAVPEFQGRLPAIC
jgi:tetratricopeptide (TPR) repeat protein